MSALRIVQGCVYFAVGLAFPVIMLFIIPVVAIGMIVKCGSIFSNLTSGR